MKQGLKSPLALKKHQIVVLGVVAALLGGGGRYIWSKYLSEGARRAAQAGEEALKDPAAVNKRLVEATLKQDAERRGPSAGAKSVPPGPPGKGRVDAVRPEVPKPTRTPNTPTAAPPQSTNSTRGTLPVPPSPLLESSQSARQTSAQAKSEIESVIRLASPAPSATAVSLAEPSLLPPPSLDSTKPAATKSDEAPTLHPSEQEYRHAQQALSEGNVANAIQHLWGALERRPNHYPAQQLLTTLLVERGRGEDAVAMLERCLRERPRQTKAAMLLAKLLEQRGEPDHALRILRAHQRYAPRDREYAALVGSLAKRSEAQP